MSPARIHTTFATGHVQIPRLHMDDRFHAYINQTGRSEMTPKQRRRYNKKLSVNLYRKVCIGCKKTYRKCECPF